MFSSKKSGFGVRDVSFLSIYEACALQTCCDSDITSSLIEGLPDAVALYCLARIPFYLYPHLQLVCRSWRAALRSSELFKVRLEIGTTEDFLCVTAYEPDKLWQLYDPHSDRWMTLPPLPSKIKQLTNFGAASVDGKLFVLGGNSDAVDPLTGDHDGIFPTNEVWSYDPILRQWTSRAQMLVARAMFACCALKGKIIVAGGFTDCRKSISKAEVYDPEKDTWRPISDLQHTHNSACSGVVISDKFHVLHKGLSTVQVLDCSHSHWSVEDYGWVQGPMATVSGELFAYSNGIIIQEAKQQRPRKVVAPATDFQSRIGFALIGLGNDLYVIGGVDGPGQWNLPIKLLSDVDVLDVRSERPTWRQVSPMTQCQGTIVGCTLIRM